MPNTPPSSRIMLFAPATLPIASIPNPLTTEFCAAGMAIETPTPATMNGASISAYARPGSAIRASQAIPAACSARPATISGRPPADRSPQPAR
jgi:hypothetical protein